MEIITVGVPNRPDALGLAAEFLRKLAELPADSVTVHKGSACGPTEFQGLTSEERAAILPPPGIAVFPIEKVTFPPVEEDTIVHSTIPVNGPPAAPTAGPELDVTGIPWDERIHSSNHAKNQDGTWRNRRGVDPNLLQRVTNELLAQSGKAPTAPAPPPTTTVPPMLNAAVSAAPAVTAPPAPPAPASMTFIEFVQKVVAQQNAGKISIEETNGICAAYGLQHFTGLQQQPQLIPQVYAALEGVWSGR